VKDRDIDSVFSCGYPVFSEEFVEEALFSSPCVLGCFVKNQLAGDMWVYVWVF
jgi:hypothetical protein